MHLGALFVQQLRTEVGLDMNMCSINTHNHEIDVKCPIVRLSICSQVWPQGPSCHKYLKDAIFSSPPLGGQFKYKTNMQICKCQCKYSNIHVCAILVAISLEFRINITFLSPQLTREGAVPQFSWTVDNHPRFCFKNLLTDCWTL